MDSLLIHRNCNHIWEDVLFGTIMLPLNKYTDFWLDLMISDYCSLIRLIFSRAIYEIFEIYCIFKSNIVYLIHSALNICRDGYNKVTVQTYTSARMQTSTTLLDLSKFLFAIWHFSEGESHWIAQYYISVLLILILFALCVRPLSFCKHGS